MTDLEFSLDAQIERDRLAIEAHHTKKERDREYVYDDLKKHLNHALVNDDREYFDAAFEILINDRADDKDWNLIDALIFAAMKAGLPEAAPVYERMIESCACALLHERNMAEVQ